MDEIAHPEPWWRRAAWFLREAVCVVVRHWWGPSPASAKARHCRICGLTEVWLERVDVKSEPITFEVPPRAGSRMVVYYKDLDTKRFDALGHVKTRVSESLEDTRG